jgi:hypothetical protein
MSHVYNEWEFNVSKGEEKESKLQEAERVNRERRIRLMIRYNEYRRKCILEDNYIRCYGK